MEGTKISEIAFFFAVVGTLAAHVSPPAHVTLDCHNFHNVLHWNYTQLDLMPRFRINIRSVYNYKRRTSEPLWANSSNLQSDVSFLSDPSDDDHDDYYLTVTAVIGGNESDPVGIRFSYNQDSMSDQKCTVDFPPVNVTVKPGGIIKFSFQHPSLYHQRLEEDEELPGFTYYASTPQHTEEEEHDCEESVCEGELPPVNGTGQEKYCLRIHGEWKSIAVLPEEFCAEAQEPDANISYDYTALYIVLPLLLCAALCVIALMMYRKQTHGSASLPASMIFPGRLKQKILIRDDSLVPDSLSIHPSSPTDKHLLSSGDSPDAQTPEEEGRLRIGVSIPDEDRVAEGEGPASSGYEPRSRLVVVELAEGDQAEGYH